jgi:NADPH:quinone reductase-like Zn-dependent oxidoreductase
MHLTEGLSLVEANVPRPKPGPDELLIRVRAAGVTTAELQWYPTSHDRHGQRRFGAIPSHEFSGVVAGVGRDVGSLEIGEEVFGMNDWFENGAMADYCVAPFSAVAPKPACLTHVEAASVPIGALTAWQGLMDRARLRSGETVLVHGGAGAVGVFAIQLAHLHGARVITTVSARNADFVRNLGADEVIDYQTTPFDEVVRGVDVVFDTVGGDTLDRSWNLLNRDGRLVTIVSSAENTADERIGKAFFIVEPNQMQLSVIADLLESRRLRPVLDAVVPLCQAGNAYMGRLERRSRGKVVVEVAAA